MDIPTFRLPPWLCDMMLNDLRDEIAGRPAAAPHGFTIGGEPVPEEYADAPASRSRQPQMAPKAAPAAEPPKAKPPVVTTAFIPLTTEELHELREQFRVKEFGAAWLAEEWGLSPEYAQEIVNQLRDEQSKKKAKAA
jgi:hypothetical protein